MSTPDMRPPSDSSHWGVVGTYLWMVGLSFWGYVADFGHRVLRKQDVSEPYWKAFLLDLPGAVFFGVLTYYVGTSTGVDEWVLGAMVGLAGHIGGRGIYQIEGLLIRYVKKRIGSAEADSGGGPTK